MNRKVIELLFAGMRPECLVSWINAAEMADQSVEFHDIYDINNSTIWQSIAESIGIPDMLNTITDNIRNGIFCTEDPFFVFEREGMQFISFANTADIIQHVGIDKLIDEFINQLES